jgi:heme/copper-type cytochrome/quinol oxidase subunit 3
MAEPSPAGAPRLMSSPEEAAYELRAQEGAIWTGGRMLIGIGAFVFASLAFAYFYLRSANNAGLWDPRGITAPQTLGAAIFAVAIASVAFNVYGTLRMRKGDALDWEVSGWTAVGGLLLACGLQAYEMSRLPFFPGSSGYASVFIGWGALNAAMLLLAAYWLETLLARALRLRRAVAADGGPSRSPAPPARLFRANLESCTYFLGFVALVELLFWVVLYLI